MTDTNTDPNYQDILNKYSEDLKEAEKTPDPLTEVEMTPVAEPELKPEPEVNPEPEITTQPAEVTPEPEVNPEPTLPPLPPIPPVDTLPPPVSSEIPTDSSEQVIVPAPPRESNFFKYLFFFSLIAFLTVLFFVVRSFLQSQQNISQPVLEQEAIPALSVTPVSKNTQAHCKFGDQGYSLGQTIQADDGCNTCTCEDSGELVCTTKTCSATGSAQNGQANVATHSANNL